MQTGIFRGIENGQMKCEYQTTICVNRRNGPDENGNWSDRAIEKRIFSYPVGGDSPRDTGFYGFGPRGGTIGFAPDMPAIGQEVQWDGPKPDMAGHLMVYVYPDEVA